MIKLSEKDKIFHDRFVSYGLNAKEWMRKCAFLLPEIERRKIWQKKGFSSIFEYATKLAGMSHKTVIDSLRILKKIEDKPNLQQVVLQKGINCIKPVIAIVTKENEKYWAEKAKAMSKNTLAVFVKGLRCSKSFNFPQQQGIFNEDGETGLSKDKKQNTFDYKNSSHANTSNNTGTIISMELSFETALMLEKLKGQGSWDELMKEFIKIREKKIESEKPESIKTNSRHIPNAIKSHVLAKTNGSCAFPGCVKPAEILHHTKRFALQKEHEPDFIVGLCKAHERLAHLGLIENEDMVPEKWKILEKPDIDYENSGKFGIDRIVNRFRAVLGNSR